MSIATPPKSEPDVAPTPTPAPTPNPSLAPAPGSRWSDLGLILGFLAIIVSVPVFQTCVELFHGERVQATDVFRTKPAAGNFRQYEHTLEQKSLVQEAFRPRVREFLFASLRETGAKAILGRDGWLFYRPDVRCLVEPDRPDPGDPESKWVEAGKPSSRHESVVHAIVRFRDQLKTRGIVLLVVPIPGKPSVYPDQVTSRLAGKADLVRSPTLDLIQALRSQGVEVADLFALFQQARKDGHEPESESPLYLRTDTHWTPVGARLAAEEVAGEMRRLKFVSGKPRDFQIRDVRVDRNGDIVEMMQTPGVTNVFSPQTVICQQVLDPVFGPLIPAASSRPGTCTFPGGNAEILVLGDSFSRIYQFPEPQSLGALPDAAPPSGTEKMTKRLLPGSAGFVSHLAVAIKAPVDCIYSDGGAATDCRRKLSTNPEILEGKKVVVWTFVERDIALGRQGWEDVDLPRPMN